MKKKEDIACLNCGKLFHPARKETKFCCRQCGTEYNKTHGVYKKSDEMKAKLSAARMGKDPWNKGRKMTQEEIDKMKASVKAAWTEEKREAQRTKQKEIWSDPERLAKHSAKCKEHMTEAYKEEISRKTRAAMENEEVKQNMHEAFNKTEVKEKRMKTNQERYGVNWIVQSELYTKASFKNKTNDNWDNFLDIDNKTREFPLENYIYDFKIGDNTLVEINPSYTHNSTNTTWYNNDYAVDKDYHKSKSLMAWKHSFECIHVWDWDDKYKIKNLLTTVKYKISGHKCTVKEIDTQTANDFLNKYHLQNSCRGIRVALGLYYNDTLIAVSTYGNSRYNKNYEWEWLRFANNNEYLIQGGAAHKLHNYFIKTYSPKSIISYCDKSKFTGSMFKHLNYTLLSNGTPSCHFYNPKTKQHFTQSEVNKLGACRILNIPQIDRETSGKDNKDIMLENNFVEIYDCGQASYTWTPS